MWSRRKLGEAAQGIADHLLLIEQVKALQTAQKEIAEAVGQIGERLRKIEADMAALKAEVKLDAIKEAQGVVYAVQSDLNRRIQEVAVKVAVADATRPSLPTPEIDN